MLRFLAIRHLAVIDRLELDFEPGLTVLTGETGAGKSILVGAVGLLVGGRASADLVRTGEDAATIEAIFDAADGREILVRREISAQGRSRAFIDGSLATSAALRELATALVDLHGQHEHQVLLDPASHLDVLDAYAAVEQERHAVAEAFAAWQRVKTERDRVLTSQRENASRAEFLSFQLGEIDRVAPKANEDEELSATRQVLANADKLQRLCADAYQTLYEGDQAALASLGLVWKKVGELTAIDDRFAPHLAARETIKPPLEDLAYFLRSYAADIDASPARLQEVEDRLAALERLKKKHGPTLADVIARRDQLMRELHAVEHGTELVAALDAELAKMRDEYLMRAAALSERRRSAAPVFCRTLERSLADLAMAKTRCEARFTPAVSETSWTERGTEAVEFYISPNPGEDLKPLARIASGGELSRIMLALKTLGSTDAPGKTLIFDEVDTGVGGAVADVVGARLRSLSDRVQVLCITHLPQIAAYGQSHLYISKSVRQGRTVTTVERLTPDARQEEIARMIGGSEISAAVRASAKEMLASRENGGERRIKGKSESETRVAARKSTRR
ncbi:MAG TPA: DNA repair protein RecN [Vicinamibacterales bacterium]|nr:DNA repair protein RecN [Vicinamibacterales bacterium]